MKSYFLYLLLGCLFCLSLSGCIFRKNHAAGFSKAIQTTDATIIERHVHLAFSDIREFTTRLYARNPKYEPDVNIRQVKLDCLLGAGLCADFSGNDYLPSDKLLTLAFDAEIAGDRVYLLGLGMMKSIQEAYALEKKDIFLSALQVSLEPIERLHFNLSQVNWRLKTYRDKNDDLLFLTNGLGDNGYLNMGYEVIMTRILTRIEDDIYMLGGLPQQYMFKVSTFFLSIMI